MQFITLLRVRAMMMRGEVFLLMLMLLLFLFTGQGKNKKNILEMENHEKDSSPLEHCRRRRRR